SLSLRLGPLRPRAPAAAAGRNGYTGARRGAGGRTRRPLLAGAERAAAPGDPRPWRIRRDAGNRHCAGGGRHMMQTGAEDRVADLPPAKGDSDTGGRTPEDIQLEPGTLLEV